MAAVRRTGAFPGRLTPLYHLRTWLLPDCTGRVDFRPFGVLTFDTPNAYINLIRHAAASVRNFRVHELAGGRDQWTFDMVTHEGPFFKDGYFVIQDKPGLGIELNPDVVKAHLAPGEQWWG